MAAPLVETTQDPHPARPPALLYALTWLVWLSYRRMCRSLPAVAKVLPSRQKSMALISFSCSGECNKRSASGEANGKAFPKEAPH